MAIAERIHRVIAVGGDHVAIDLDGDILCWKALGEAADALVRLLATAGLGRDKVVGLLGRNRLEQVGGFIALLGADHAVTLINAVRPAALTAEEVGDLALACLIGSHADLAPEIVAAARQCGTMVVAVDAAGGGLRFSVVAAPGVGPFRERSSGTLIEIQTSGTTGKPKRIPISERTIAASLQDGVRNASGAVEQAEITPKSSPTLMFGPLVHTSGTFNTLMSVFEARPIVLFERFDAEKYRTALVQYRPRFVSLMPTAIKMMLDSDATPADFASVIAVRSGTAALPVDLQIAFEERFGVPVLTTYGATEFLGVVTSWTLDDHKRFSVEKRGSVGRVGKGVQIRIVDPATRADMPIGEQGILEARLDRIDGGSAWIGTTDLARIDGDGFLYILGRIDDAIIRGGFKVMAGKVADRLRQYPGVYDVIVMGRADDRLGEVPVAVVEPCPGAPAIKMDELRAFAKQHLTAYEVPVRFHIVEKLPRTVSDKVVRPAVKALLDGLEAG